MADVLSKSSAFLPCGRQFSIRRSSGRSCFDRSCSVRSSMPVKPLRFSSGSDFHGRKIVGWEKRREPSKALKAVPVQMALRLRNAVQWWEKGLQPNMKEVQAAQDLVDSLANAGDKLVIVDFFSPGCGGCRALHPKICQFAETNPDVLFLQINYEEHKSMCYSLNVHVLPFFRFYRGAHGRLCSFSCTNATIKKFKDALAKHSTERCSLGPTRGLEESELMALAANKDLDFTYTEAVKPVPERVPAPVKAPEAVPRVPLTKKASQGAEEKAIAGAGR